MAIKYIEVKFKDGSGPFRIMEGEFDEKRHVKVKDGDDLVWNHGKDSFEKVVKKPVVTKEEKKAPKRETKAKTIGSANLKQG